MDQIKVKWTRGRDGNYVGYYAIHTVLCVNPSWVEFAEIRRTLTGVTLTSVALQEYASLDYRLIRDAKADAHDAVIAAFVKCTNYGSV